MASRLCHPFNKIIIINFFISLFFYLFCFVDKKIICLFSIIVTFFGRKNNICSKKAYPLKFGKKNGHFKKMSFRQGYFKKMSFRQGYFKKMSFRQGHFKKMAFRQRHVF